MRAIMTPRHAIAASLLSGLLLSAAAPLPAYEMPMPRDHELRLAGLFGESDEEKAARLAAQQKEADQDAAIADLKAQIRDLEDTVRRLTGANEVLSHKVEQFDSRVDRMQKDFDYKLCTVMAQQVGGDTGSLPCDGTTAANPPLTLTPPPPSQTFTPGTGAPRQLAPPPGTLGTMPRSAPPPNGVPSDTAAANASPFRAEFDTALNLLGKAQYEEARAAFRGFADSHPKDDLAPQAVFWIGNIAYVQKDYASAARAFAEGIKKYPSSSRAAESMLKLGQSLIAMGQKKEGCFTLGSLAATYPKASKSTFAQAEAARKASCK
jgi:tol-pal system protein YbgF